MATLLRISLELFNFPNVWVAAEAQSNSLSCHSLAGHDCCKSRLMEEYEEDDGAV